MSIPFRLLLGSPNPDDPLRDDVSDEYRYNRELFNKNAKRLSGDKCSEAAGNSSKKFKADKDDLETTTTGGASDLTQTGPFGERHHEMPNTSNGNIPNEAVSLESKANRKRKHEES